MDDTMEDTICACCCELITPVVHVSCCECEAKLCVSCFRMGAEVGEHKRGHNYEVVDQMGRPTFERKGAWGCVEETKLIEAAHRYKLGNWVEMSQMMKTTRSQNECVLYFDTYYIRGPIGQFALRDLQWHKHKDEYRKSGFMQSLLDKHNRNDMKYNLYLSALRWKKDVTLSTSDENLKEEVRKIAKEYVNFDGEVKYRDILAADTADVSLHLDSPLPPVIRCNTKLSKHDPFDSYSEDEEEEEEEQRTPRRPIGRYTETKVEPADESFSEEKPAIKVVLKKVDRGDGYMVANDSYRREGHSKAESSYKDASDDDDNAGKEVVSADDDIGESSLLTEDDDLHGLEKEMSSESEESDHEPVTKKRRTSRNCATVTPKSQPKKRKKMWKSKKQRRLESFQKRMATQARKREKELEKHEEIVSKETIANTRKQHHPLSLYRTKPRLEKPKFRQDDCALLGYNPERNDFEIESFNEAETLISELTVALPKYNNEMINAENNIKFARIQNYKRTLMVRNARRTAIVEHDKITEFFDFMRTMTVEKRKASQIMEQRPPMEKLLSRLKQTLTKEEHTRLSERLEKFQNLKMRIEKLQELQRQGVTSLKGCDLGTTPTKKKKVKGNSETKRKAGLRWKAIQRQHLKMVAE